MKKRTTLLIALIMSVLSLCFVFAACGDDGNNTDTKPSVTYSLDKITVSLAVGDTHQIVVKSTSTDAFTATYKSDKTNIATVTDKGLVEAVAEGTAKITVSVGSQTLTLNVTVTPEEVLYTYTLNETEKELERNDSFKLDLTCEPTHTFEVTWESNDTDIVTVNENGLVTAVGAGTTTVDAKVDNEVKASCEFTVKEFVYTYTEELTVEYGKTAKIEVTVAPSKDMNLTFTPVGTDKITIAEDGTVTAVGLGEETVTIKDGEKTVGTCTVTVEPNVEIPEKLALHVGDTENIEVVVTPSDGTPDITYAITSGDDVISLDTATGAVTALKDGSATVKVTVNGVENECAVTVSNLLVNELKIEKLDMDKNNPIDITSGAEYWEQYIARDEVNHKQYSSADEDIIEHVFPIVSGKIHYLADYKAWLAWHGGATRATCSCGKCKNKDTQNGSGDDGGWTDNGTKSYFSLEYGSDAHEAQRSDLLQVKHSFNIKVFPGVSTIKIYTGGFLMKARVDVKFGGNVIATETFAHEAHESDMLSLVVDVKEATTVTLDFTVTETTGAGNGFISFAGASVSGDVYRLNKYTTRILPGQTDTVSATKNGIALGEGDIVTFTSSNTDVVTVGETTGVVTYVGNGSADITVNVNGRIRVCKVNTGYGYSVDSTNVSLLSGQTHQIAVISEPTGSTAQATYTSNGTGIATVSNTGLITAVAEGETTITVDVDGSTFTVKVVVARAAVKVSDRSFKGDFIDLTRPEVVYWEYYSFGEISTPKDKEDLIEDSPKLVVGADKGESNGYGAFIYFNNANTKANTYDDSAFMKYCKASSYGFDISMPAGHHELRVYTGAWENTVNKVSLLDGDKELSSVTLAKETGGRSTLVTFDTTTAEVVSLKLKIEAQEGDNCRLMAIAIVDVSNPVASTTSVELANSVELTGASGDNASRVNLSEAGNLDWVVYNIENVPDGPTTGNVVKKTGGNYLSDTMPGATGEWDYKAGITWNDGDAAVNAGACRDGDTGSIGEGYHNNFCRMSDVSNKLNMTVKVDANVKTITVYASAWKASYAIEVYDSHGNKLLAQPICTGDAPNNGSRAYAITFNVTATVEENLTISLFKTNNPGGNANCGVAAIAVGGTAA